MKTKSYIDSLPQLKLGGWIEKEDGERLFRSIRINMLLGSKSSDLFPGFPRFGYDSRT